MDNMRKTIIVIASILIAFIPLPRLEPPLQDIGTKKVVAEVRVEPKVEIVVPSQPLDNEAIAWNFFIANGFNANQTAGIMANLKQEHNFQTSDVAGGLGIAQWVGNRRDNLMSKDNYLDINVQLQFIIEELNSYENTAKMSIINSTTIEEATRAFQNKYERCGICREYTRIQYGYEVLEKYGK